MISTADLEADLARYFAEAERACPREPDLARHLAGELTGPDAAALHEHLRACVGCASLSAALDDTAHAWHAPVAAPSEPIPFPRRLQLFVAPALALAAALLAFVLAGPRAVPGADPDRLTPKGTWSLELAVQRGGEQFLAPSGAWLRKGDQLGLFYSSASDGWLTVLYADGHEAPLRVFPARQTASAKVTAGHNLPLSDGAVLGEGHGCEWVVGVFTRAPLAAAEAEQLVRQMVAARQGCALTVPKGAHADVQVVVVNR